MSKKPSDQPRLFRCDRHSKGRAQLEQEAAGKALGAYVRDQILGKQARLHAWQDHQTLGRVLAALGASRLASKLNQLAYATHTGSLPVPPEIERELLEACESIRAIRDDLLRALGART